jgi:predicted transcriptional regulator
MNIKKLKAKIVEKGMNVETLADRIGIDRSSLYRKLNNFEKITIGEASKMKDALEMSEAEATDIFFSSTVA